MVTLVSLMENVLASAHLDHFKAIDQLQLVVLVKALEQLYPLQVLKVDVASSDRVLRDDLLENVT